MTALTPLHPLPPDGADAVHKKNTHLIRPLKRLPDGARSELGSGGPLALPETERVLARRRARVARARAAKPKGHA